MNKKYLTVKELAQLTPWSKATIYRMVADRVIPYIKVGANNGKILFDWDRVEAYLEEHTIEPIQ